MRLKISVDHLAIKYEQDISEDVITTHENIIKKLPIKRIRHLRNKRYAHFDNLENTKLTGINLGEIDKILSTAKQIWNTYHTFF